MKQFRICFQERLLEDLHHRILNARYPQLLAGGDWNLGIDDGYFASLMSYWCNEYDWYQREAELNRYPQFTCEIDGMTIHFFHIRGSKPGTLPILLTHGWPDSFLRYAKLFPMLFEFDIVVPSLPGFAFSSLPPKGFANNADAAEIWHKLMTQVLGYKRYAASGGDMGRGVTCYLAANHPEEVAGIHLTDAGFASDLVAQPDDVLTYEELDYKNRAQKWTRMEGAYISINSTKPQTLAYMLSDSPVGMASWLVEKYHAWSDWNLLTMDDLCDCLTLYWMTNTACTSIRAYHGNSFTLPPLGAIHVPTAIAAFPHDILPVPRTWIEKHFPIVRYTEMSRGGHFTALEQPIQFAQDIAAFMRSIQ